MLDIDAAEAQGILTTPFDVLEAVSGKSVTLTDPDNNADGSQIIRRPGDVALRAYDFDQDEVLAATWWNSRTRSDPTADDTAVRDGI